MDSHPSAHPLRRKTDRLAPDSPGAGDVRRAGAERRPTRRDGPDRAGSFEEGILATAASAITYCVVAAGVVGLAYWLGRDLTWLLADLGIRRALGSATAVGTLLLAAIAGAAIALPLRPFLAPKRWRRSVWVLSCSAWLLCALWLLLGG